MRVLTVVHQDDAGPGVFADVMDERGDQVIEWRPAERDIRSDPYDAVIVLGGAANAQDAPRLAWLAREKKALRALVAAGLPILGVCLGSQLVAEAAGGSVRRSERPEIGWYEVALEPAAAADPVLGGLPARFEAFQWHSFEAVAPPGAAVLASSAVCPQAWRLDGRPVWGIQFHAEVSLPDALRWCEDYRADPDAVALGVDPALMAAQLRERHAAWAEIGATVCKRFLSHAAGEPIPPAGGAQPDR